MAGTIQIDKAVRKHLQAA